MKYNLLFNSIVSIYENKKIDKYFDIPPYNPGIKYPEYPFEDIQYIEECSNEIYEAVRNTLILLNLDSENINAKNWNPLGKIIKPGDSVVIKPNFVIDKHVKNGDIWSVTTHPSIIRAIVDYVFIALKGRGKLTIGDAPQADADFDNFLQISKVESIKKLYKDKFNFDINIYDLRQIRYMVNDKGFLDENSRIQLNGDPLGYSVIDLKHDSEFASLKTYDKLYGADYDRSETIKHHSKEKNEYCISNTIIDADVVISVPKMKIHRKAGVTLNMKNLVGINGNKNYLPHFQIGESSDGGDEFPRLDKKQKVVFYSNRKLIDKFLSKPNKIKSYLYKSIKQIYKVVKSSLNININTKNVIVAGDWYGNDTVWRMVVDLNKILLYADKNGVMQETPQRKFISFIDGIIAGEGEGPLIPDAKKCGVIVVGFNPYVVDVVSTRLMGMDYRKIRIFNGTQKLEKYKIYNGTLDNFIIKSNNMDYINILKNDKDRFLNFKPSKGWEKNIEI